MEIWRLKCQSFVVYYIVCMVETELGDEETILNRPFMKD